MEIFGEKKRKRESFGILYPGYPLSIVKIRERERKRERERERESERERDTKNSRKKASPDKPTIP